MRNNLTRRVTFKIKRICFQKKNMSVECKDCFRIFSAEQYMKRHVCRPWISSSSSSSSGDSENNDYTCDLCGKRFDKPSGLARHVETHSKEKKYHCRICDRWFRESRHLAKHEATALHRTNVLAQAATAVPIIPKTTSYDPKQWGHVFADVGTARMQYNDYGFRFMEEDKDDSDFD